MLSLHPHAPRSLCLDFSLFTRVPRALSTWTSLSLFSDLHFIPATDFSLGSSDDWQSALFIHSLFPQGMPPSTWALRKCFVISSFSPMRRLSFSKLYLSLFDRAVWVCLGRWVNMFSYRKGHTCEKTANPDIGGPCVTKSEQLVHI